MLTRRFFVGRILLFLLGLSLSCTSTGLRYTPSKEVRHTLKNEQVRIVDNKRYFGDAWMEKRGDLYFLHLKGSPYEVGYQHGVLMRDEIKQGVVKAYADPINAGRGGFSLMAWALGKYLEWKVYRPFEKAQPKDILEELKGIADGSGVPYKTIFKANHDAGVHMVMMPVLVKSNIKKFTKSGIEVSACSTFVVTKEASLNGKTIVGRNTDYHGLEGWPKYQTVSFVEPRQGYKYVELGTAGILMWTPGMNEKGIVLCQHMMFYDDVTPNGWSIPAFTDEILRKADSIDSAIEIVQNNPRGVSCGFVIIDGKTKDTVALEVSTGSVAIRPLEDGMLAMTNMAILKEKQKIDFVVKYHLNEGCPGRYFRLMQLIKENYGKIDPSLAAEFMGDHIRITTNTERTTYGILGVTYNVNSAVFSPEDLKLWVAAGPAPVCNNPYIGLDFQQEIKGIQSKVTPEILEGYRFKNPNKRLGMYKYNQAFILYEQDPKQVDDMLNLIQEASELDPEEAIYYRMIAKFLIHKGLYDEAISSIEKALPLKQSLNETAHNYLLLGILYDLKEDRQKALSYYHKIDDLMQQKVDDPWFKLNSVLWAFTQKYENKPFGKKQLKDRCVSIGFAQDTGIE
ncbi:MAG: hypothetical protein J7L53_03485 [Deltaproteobacteria bacterium]|nr:hypothetical protein [Deltaproteobacteria bacterium]